MLVNDLFGVQKQTFESQDRKKTGLKWSVQISC